jgi:glycosyltransferase involved in cell wall biosynthesis
MRVLAATNLYPPYHIGGYELRCRDIVKGLSERGHEVHVLTSNHGIPKNAVEGGVYRWLPTFVYEYTEIPDDGVPTQLVKAARGVSMVRSLIRKHQVELIYISKVQGFQEPVITALANSGVPVVWDISDLWLTTFGQGPWFSYWKKKPDHKYLSKPKAAVRSIVSRIVPVSWGPMGFGRACYTSAFLRDYYGDRGFPVDEAQVIHCGCPEMFFHSEDKKRLAEPFRFLYAGQLVEGKGVHTILEAGAHLCTHRPDIDFRIDIVGSGVPEYEERLAFLIKKHRLHERVKLLGRVPREGMAEVYRRYDGLIFPSIWEEAFALTLLESMASELPVISTATGGNREIIDDERTALEFEPGNSAHLATQMERLMTDASLRGRLREKGKRLVSERLRVSHMVDAVEKYIEETVIVASKNHECSGIRARTTITYAASC